MSEILAKVNENESFTPNLHSHQIKNGNESVLPGSLHLKFT